MTDTLGRFETGERANPNGRRGKRRSFGSLIQQYYTQEPDKALAIVEALDAIGSGRAAGRAGKVVESLDAIMAAASKEVRKAAVPLLNELREMVGMLADPRTRIAAISEIIDRTDGKPAQSLDVSGRIQEVKRVVIEEIPPDILRRIREVEGNGASEHVALPARASPPSDAGAAGPF